MVAEMGHRQNTQHFQDKVIYEAENMFNVN